MSSFHFSNNLFTLLEDSANSHAWSNWKIELWNNDVLQISVQVIQDYFASVEAR